MSKETKNTKVTENKTVAKKVEKTVEPKAPKFDRKAYGSALIKNFKSDAVTLAFDTDFQDGPRATSENDYRYIHVFRKGTTKNCFQMYTSSQNVQIVVGKNIDALMPESKKYTKKAITKAGKLSYYVYIIPTEKSEDVLSTLQALVDAYKKHVAAGEEKKAAEEKAKTEKQAEKKAKAEAKKVEKPAKPKKETKTA